MAIYRPTNSQLRRALVSAKAKIQRREVSYVCIALRGVGNADPSRRAATTYLRQYISKQLGQHAFLEGWQDSRRSAKLRNRGFVQARLDRLAWIDWMIANLKEEC